LYGCPKVLVLINCGLKNIVIQIQTDQFKQNWSSEIFGSSKCSIELSIYRCFKTEPSYEDYLNVLPNNLRVIFNRFRCRNFNIPVEKGSYFNIPLVSRTCNLCNADDIGDEFHYLFECAAFTVDRNKYLKQFFITRPNTLKMNQLFNSDNPKTLRNLASFVKIIMLKFN